MTENKPWTVTPEMVEAAAKAVFDQDPHPSHTWEQFSSIAKKQADWYRANAKAAISAALAFVPPQER